MVKLIWTNEGAGGSDLFFYRPINVTHVAGGWQGKERASSQLGNWQFFSAAVCPLYNLKVWYKNADFCTSFGWQSCHVPMNVYNTIRRPAPSYSTYSTHITKNGAAQICTILVLGSQQWRSGTTKTSGGCSMYSFVHIMVHTGSVEHSQNFT